MSTNYLFFKKLHLFVFLLAMSKICLSAPAEQNLLVFNMQAETAESYDDFVQCQSSAFRKETQLINAIKKGEVILVENECIIIKEEGGVVENDIGASWLLAFYFAASRTRAIKFPNGLCHLKDHPNYHTIYLPTLTKVGMLLYKKLFSAINNDFHSLIPCGLGEALANKGVISLDLLRKIPPFGIFLEMLVRAGHKSINFGIQLDAHPAVLSGIFLETSWQVLAIYEHREKRGGFIWGKATP